MIAPTFSGETYVLFLRNEPRDAIPEIDRRLAPVLALCITGIIGVAFVCFWIAYLLGVK